MIKEFLCNLVLIACLEYFGHSKLVKREDGWSYFTGRGCFSMVPKTFMKFLPLHSGPVT